MCLLRSCWIGMAWQIWLKLFDRFSQKRLMKNRCYRRPRLGNWESSVWFCNICCWTLQQIQTLHVFLFQQPALKDPDWSLQEVEALVEGVLKNQHILFAHFEVKLIQYDKLQDWALNSCPQSAIKIAKGPTNMHISGWISTNLILGKPKFWLLISCKLCIDCKGKIGWNYSKPYVTIHLKFVPWLWYIVDCFHIAYFVHNIQCSTWWSGFHILCCWLLTVNSLRSASSKCMSGRVLKGLSASKKEIKGENL